MISSLKSVEQLETLLSEPTPGAIEAMGELEGDILLLGVAGKMGPTLAHMAKRASELSGKRRRVIGVSRFSSGATEVELQAQGIETIRCDLLDQRAVQNLPDAPNVIYLAGMKFGSTGYESLTWAMNTYLPAIICNKFSRSKIVAFSTGNIYGLVPATGPGSLESDSPSPAGEYAMSCLGRERIFEHFSRTLQIPIALIRLNYACELRYGVLIDLARKIFNGEPIDLRMGWFNVLWQADANAMTLQCFAHVSSPPFIINLTGAEKLSVRETCETLAIKMDKKVSFIGEEKPTALLNNSQKAFQLFGEPHVKADELIEWISQWTKNGGTTLGKPTHFESRDGKF